MNDCPNGDMRDQLPDLLHERLPAPDRALVAAHVAGCVDCREELALLGSLMASMRRVPGVPVATIVAALPAYRTPARRTWGSWRAAAAITAIVLGGGATVVVARQSPRVPDAPTTVASLATDVATGSQAVAPLVPVVAPRLDSGVSPRGNAGQLAVGSSVADLSDGELALLLDEIESMDALPSADVESSALVPLVAPARGTS